MAIVQAVCTSFKQELLIGEHNFTASTGDTFKIALFTSSASLGAGTTAYSTSSEVTGTGYSAGGNTLTNVTPTSSGTTAYTSFTSPTTWTTSTITARGAVIYNATSTGATNKSIVVLDFSSDKTSTAGDFSIVFPTADATSAIIRIA